MLKVLGLNYLNMKCFQAIGFKYRPAPLHHGSKTADEKQKGEQLSSSAALEDAAVTVATVVGRTADVQASLTPA